MASQPALWKGIVIGIGSVVGLLVIAWLGMWLVMGRCPMCGGMMGGEMHGDMMGANEE